MKIWLALPLLATAAPAWAGWGSVNWGMSSSEVIAAGGAAIAPVKDDKGKRIRGMLRLATGRTDFEGVSFDVEYFFDPKTKRLAAINFTPAKTQCDAARAAHTTRFGTPSESKKIIPIEQGKPPLVQVEYEWSDGAALGGDKISGVDVSVKEFDIRYCQFLRTG